MAGSGTDPRARRRARRALLQALYAWQLTGAAVTELRAQFSFTAKSASPAGTALADAERNLVERTQLRGADEAFFAECLAGVVRHRDDLDALFVPYLDRALDALDHVERAILRAGTFELRSRPDVPPRVAINEWVELAKGFGAEESHRYVNGVLDRVARDLRDAELREGARAAPAS